MNVVFLAIFSLHIWRCVCKGRLTPMRRVALRTHRKFVRACGMVRRGSQRQKSAISKWIGLFPQHFYVKKQKMKNMKSEIKGKDFRSMQNYLRLSYCCNIIREHVWKEISNSLGSTTGNYIILYSVTSILPNVCNVLQYEIHTIM